MRFLFTRTVKLGRIAGIDIEIDWSWFIIFVLVFSSLAFEFFPRAYGFGTSLSVALGLGTAVLFFSSVLLHELAHSIVANRNGVTISKIILFVFGGVASLSGEPTRPSVELKIAVAGPLTSIVLGGGLYGLALLVQPFSLPVSVALQYLSLINLGLAVFNLIPGYPLDGGRILRALIWRWSSMERATRIAARIGMGVGYLIMSYGILQFIYLGSLFGLIWFGLIGYFLVNAARESILQVSLMILLSNIKVRDVLEPSPVVIADTLDLRSFVQRVLLGRKRTSALVSRGGRVVGEINLDMARRLPTQALSTKHVSDLMSPVSPRSYLKPSMNAARALQKLMSDRGPKFGFEQLPVYERGKLVGAVSRDDLRVYLAVRTDVLNRDPHLQTRL